MHVIVHPELFIEHAEVKFVFRLQTNLRTKSSIRIFGTLKKTLFL